MENQKEVKKIFLMLFDISGYTKFVCRHEDQFPHAEEIISSLLSTVISSVQSPCTMYEITGDAVSFYVESEGGSRTAWGIWDQVDRVFNAFREKERELREASAKSCPHCAETTQLKLKAVLHHCEVVFTDLHGFTKISGPQVILAHRLLKNAVQSKEYVIVTSDYYFVGGMMTPMGAVLQGEQCEGFGEIGILVWYPPGSLPREVRPANARSQPLGWK